MEWRKLSDAQAMALAVQMNSILVTDFAAYGVTSAQSLELKGNKDNFQNGLADVYDKRAAWLAAVDDKDADRENLMNTISVIANVVYNNPAVTPGMISALGLTPRATTRTVYEPKVPQNLQSFPSVNGDVKLTWSKGENTYGAVYIIESRTETEDWVQVYSTTKQKATLTGYTPGNTVWFRVRACRNDAVSSPCNQVAIYHDITPPLSLAA